MILWAICGTLGVLTVALAPLILGLTLKVLTRIGQRFPILADVAATISVIIVGAILLGMSAVFAVVFHRMLVK